MKKTLIAAAVAAACAAPAFAQEAAPASEHTFTANVGVTKDIGFGVLGLKYSDTNANKAAWNWGAASTPTDTYFAGRSRVVASFLKTF